MSKIVVSSGPDPRQADSREVKVSTAGPFVVGLVMLSTLAVVPLALLWSVGNDEAPDVSPVSAVSVSVPPSVPGCVMFCREDEMQHQSASSVPGCAMFCRDGEVQR